MRPGLPRPGRRAAATLLLASLAVACRDGGAATGGGGAARRPNIVLIVVDTLRADHLQAYGYPRPTSPHIERLLAQAGVVVERAYAAAPWTLPSVTALMSSRQPGEALPRAPTDFRLDPALPTLAPTLAALGYDTAALVANPTVHRGLGFARGFAKFFSPPTLEQGLDTHADRVSALAAAWLQRPRRRPAFLYVHYMDPHDPYDNAEVEGGRSPFTGPYRGALTGRDVHALFLGRVSMRDPAQDLPYIAGLYDTEIHYVDRFLPALFDGLDADALARTLFVFTADHGEELFDHGGWKHGRTLYEEQLRVPFIVRWDGHLPAGVRVAGPVRLLDVAPTLVAAAGGQLPPSWQGHDLAPLLAGGAPAERSPLFAEHLADGPRRAAVIARRWKLILFDRQAPFSPGNELEALSYRQELARLERVELYDLARDPGERRNLASQRPDVVARLAPLVHDQLGRERPGLRVLLAGVPEGGRLTVELRCRRLPSGWEPLFLAADDRVTAAGDRLQLELRGDPVAKGVLLPADTELLAVHTSGATPVRVRLGGGKLAGGTPTPAEMRHRGWPGGADDGPTLWLWLPPEGAPAVDARPDPETQRRLKALGYVG